jgi:hypothetical protein
MGKDHSPAKPVNAQLAAFNGIATGLRACGNPLITLHSFWTAKLALSKSASVRRYQPKLAVWMAYQRAQAHPIG